MDKAKEAGHPMWEVTMVGEKGVSHMPVAGTKNAQHQNPNQSKKTVQLGSYVFQSLTYLDQPLCRQS